MPTRIEFNCTTGERKVIELTPEEIAAAAIAKAAEDARNAAKVPPPPDPIDELRQALKDDPTLLGKLKAVK